ncbi:MFS transporter [Desulfoscipio gibsoniae]
MLGYKQRIFYFVMVLIFTDTLLYGTIVPLIPFYTQQLQLNSVMMGILFAAYSLGLLVFSIPLGIIAERYGYRKVFLAGMAGLTLATALYGFANSPEILFLCRLIQGIAAAASWTAGLAMVALLYPEQQGEKLGLVMAAMGLGTILGPPVGGMLFHYLGYREMFIALAVFCFLLLFMLCFVRFAHLAGGNRNKNFAVWQVRHNHSLIWLGVVVLISSSSFGMLEILLPNYLDGRFGLGSLQIGMVFGLMGLVHVFSDAGVGFLSDRHGYKPFVHWGLWASALCLPFLALAPNPIILTLILALLGTTLGAVLTPSQPLMYHIVAADPVLWPSGGAGLVYGVFNTCFSMGLMFGPPLGGLLEKYFGFSVGLILFAVLLMASAVLFRYKVGTVSLPNAGR